MSRAIFRSFPSIALALLVPAALGSCGASDTVLFVTVDGTTPRVLFQMQVDVTVGGQSRALAVPIQPAPLNLPTSFTVQIPRDYTGSVEVAITAFDELQVEMARGTAGLSELMVGRENGVLVSLGPMSSGADGGTDASAPDAEDPFAADAGTDAHDDGTVDAASHDVGSEAQSLDRPSDLVQDVTTTDSRDGGAGTTDTFPDAADAANRDTTSGH